MSLCIYEWLPYGPLLPNGSLFFSNCIYSNVKSYLNSYKEQQVFNMANSNPTPKFKPGNTLAADNNNQRKHRIRKSKSRKTEDALRKLEGSALENIKKSVEGETVDKEVLSTSKWIVNTILTVSKAAYSEEEVMNNLRLTLDQAEVEEQEVEKVGAPVSRFSIRN